MALSHEFNFLVMIRPNFGFIVLEVPITQGSLTALTGMLTLDVSLHLLEIYVIVLAIQAFEYRLGDMGIVQVLQFAV
jgi:hypothetical protein